MQEDEDAEVERRLNAAEGSKQFSFLHVGMIPWIVATSDCAFGLASGMTIKVHTQGLCWHVGWVHMFNSVATILSPPVVVYFTMHNHDIEAEQ